MKTSMILRFFILLAVISLNTGVAASPSIYFVNRLAALAPYDHEIPTVSDLWVDTVNGSDSYYGASTATAFGTLTQDMRINLPLGTYPNYWETRYATSTAPIMIRGNSDQPGSALQQTTAVFPFAYNSAVADMIGGVQQSDVYNYVGNLSGKSSIIVGGSSFTLTTRNMYFAAQISKATQYVYEFMQNQGLSVSYQEWYDSSENISGRNVIGALTGTLHPSEIVLITAHLDNMPESSVAPGADDNASGSVGVMMAAARLAGHQFERSVRFVFLTGEEQGTLGSYAYATTAKAKGENIVAVYNMDMIGWDANNDGVMALETRYTTSTGYTSDLAIANVFTQVVNTYGISELHPVVDPCNDQEVDSAMFWAKGYPSITAIEDWGEGNPYYHTKNDSLQNLNLTFLTSFVKASVGTVAHLAIPTVTLYPYFPVNHWLNGFGLANGWTVQDYERTVGDVNNDDRADLIGFGLDGVYVALAPSTGTAFGAPTRWSTGFGLANGWTVQNYVRTVGDVNNDGRADLIGFGLDGVYVAIAPSTGTAFGAPTRWSTGFGLANSWTVKDYVRTVGDVSGDGKADLVGFGADGVYVAVSTGTGFGAPTRWSTGFGLANGWTVKDFVRTVGDVSGDGKADLVGFGADGVYVAVSTGTGFGAVGRWSTGFGLATGWTVQNSVRTVSDVNGDGKTDLVGFGADGVYIATSTGSGFGASTQWSADFGLANGWTVAQYVRTIGDVNNDLKADLIGFGADGVYVAAAK